jgi:hypothetical protein
MGLRKEGGERGLTRNPAVLPYKDREPIPAPPGLSLSGCTALYKSGLEGHFAVDWGISLSLPRYFDSRAKGGWIRK